MFTNWIRQVFYRAVDGIAALFGRLGLSADLLTIFGCSLSIAAGVLVGFGRLRVGGGVLVIASLFDALDGTLARQQGGPTKFGAFLDSVLDRVSESAVLLGVAWWSMGQGRTVDALLAYAAIVGSLLVSYTRARAEGLGISCKVGFLTRVERCIILIAALILRLITPALWLLALGTIATTGHRILNVHAQVKGQPLEPGPEPAPKVRLAPIPRGRG